MSAARRCRENNRVSNPRRQSPPASLRSLFLAQMRARHYPRNRRALADRMSRREHIHDAARQMTVVAPAMHVAAVNQNVARAQQCFRGFGDENDFARHHDDIIDRIGGMHRRAAARGEIGEYEQRSVGRKVEGPAARIGGAGVIRWDGGGRPDHHAGGIVEQEAGA